MIYTCRQCGHVETTPPRACPVCGGTEWDTVGAWPQADISQKDARYLWVREYQGHVRSAGQCWCGEPLYIAIHQKGRTGGQLAACSDPKCELWPAGDEVDQRELRAEACRLVRAVKP